MTRQRPRTPRRKTADYEIGYKKPPKDTQFRKGQSGNLAGRPRKSKNANKLAYDILNEEMAFTENGVSKTASKREIAMRTLAAKALKGDQRAANLLIAMDDAYQSQLSENRAGSGHSIDEMMEEDEAILADLLSKGGRNED